MLPRKYIRTVKNNDKGEEEIIYTATDAYKFKSMAVSFDKQKNEFKLTITVKDPAPITMSEFYRIIQPANMAAALAVRSTGTNTYCIKTNNPEFLGSVISSLDKCEPFDLQTMSEIKIDLKLVLPVDENKVIDLLEANEFKAALSLAKESIDTSIFWNIGNFCEKQYPENIQWAVDFYQEVPHVSPYFQVANGRLLELLLSNTEPFSSDEERYQNLEMKFSCALQAGEKYTREADRFFHQLCGYSLNSQPKITHIQGDAVTLVAVAREMRALAARNLELENNVIGMEYKSANNKPTFF